MSNNRELSQFAKFTTIDESGNNNVGIATTVRISPGGLYVDGVEVIGPGGAWKGPNSGLVGAQGAQGAQGYQGVQGEVGAQGAQGSDGAQGAQGDVGAQGTQGAPGAQGDVGAQGAQGSPGAQGNQGYQGRQGAPGAQGNQGYQGRQGAPGAQGAQGAPAAGANGKILQVVQDVELARSTISTSGSTEYTVLSASITPSSTSSKILLMASVGGSVGGAYNALAFKFLRNSTSIGIANADSNAGRSTSGNWDVNGSSYGMQGRSFAFLDSPSTTSSITYYVKLRDFNGDGGTFYFNSADQLGSGETANAIATLTLMEVGP
jgi:hypothetical protein